MNRKTFMAAIAVSLLLFFLAIAAYPIYAQTPTPTPNYSDYIPTPTVPEFTVNFEQSEYNVTVTDPFTGVNTTQQVNNNSIEFTIRNQPFTPYNYSFGNGIGQFTSRSTSLWYDIQYKGHYSQDWTDLSNMNTQSSSSDYTVISVPQVPNQIAYPEGGMADFRVIAVAGGEFPNPGDPLTTTSISKNSSWSPIQTITIPATLPTPSLSPTPTPTAIYFPQWIPYAIIALVVVLGASALVYFKKRTNAK
jgi:hypothetical protein